MMKDLRVFVVAQRCDVKLELWDCLEHGHRKQSSLCLCKARGGGAIFRT